LKEKIEDQLIFKIISDTELILKEPGALKYSTEQEYQFKILPKVDQRNVFKCVEECLGGGGCIAMFPEGGSHD